MLPADERLVADDLVPVEIHDGLVVEAELLAGDSLAQLGDSLRALDRGAVEPGVEEGVADLGMALRPVHGDVGLPEHRLVVLAEGDADAGGRVERSRAALERSRDLGEQALGDSHSVRGGHGLGQDDGELVAAEAGGGVAGAHCMLDSLAKLVQHLVAEVVTPAVVDPFEVVEVDVEEPRRLAVSVPELNRMPQPFVEEGAVREAGERVVEGELPQLVLRLALLRDVEEIALQVERLAVVVEHDHALVAEMHDLAFARDEPVFDAQRLVRLVRVRVGCEHTLTVVRVEQPREEVGVGRPFLDAVAEHRLDLAAGEDVRADRVQLVEVDDERKLLDQRAIAAADLVRGQVLVVMLAERDRCRRHRKEIGQVGGLRLPRTG